MQREEEIERKRCIEKEEKSEKRKERKRGDEKEIEKEFEREKEITESNKENKRLIKILYPCSAPVRAEQYKKR